MDYTSLLAEELSIEILNGLDLHPDLIRVSHVSRRWRSLVQAHPAFWRTITVRDTQIDACNPFPKCDLACAQLLASTSDGLVVNFDVRHGRYGHVCPDARDQGDSNDLSCCQQFRTLSKALAQSMCRVTALKVVAPYQVAKLLEQGGVFASNLSLLESLEVDISDDPVGNPDCLSLDWQILRRAPKLRMLRLIDVHVQSLGRIPSHSVLEELAWWPHSNANPFMRLPRLDQFAQQFPRLRSLELLGDSRDFDIGDHSIALARLAELNYLRLGENELRELGVEMLERVGTVHVFGPSTSTVVALLQHLRVSGRKYTLDPASLHLDLWPAEDAHIVQPMVVSELIPCGRRRILDLFHFHAGIWLPHLSAVADLATRVTKLSIPSRDWSQFVEALGNGEALTELVIRVTDAADAAVNLTSQSRQACCRDLRILTLQAAQKPYKRGKLVMVSAIAFRDFVHSSIDSEAHRKMQLICDMVQFIDVGSPPALLLEPYFASIELLPV